MDIVTSLLQKIYAKNNWTVVSVIRPMIYVFTSTTNSYNMIEEFNSLESNSVISPSDIVEITQTDPGDYHTLQYRAFELTIRVQSWVTAMNLLNDAFTCEFKQSYMERCYDGDYVIVKSSSEDFGINLFKKDLKSKITDEKELEKYTETINNKMTEDMEKIKRFEEHLSPNVC